RASFRDSREAARSLPFDSGDEAERKRSALGSSGTRRVPAPSRLAQRDAAKTQTTPCEFWPNASGAKRKTRPKFTWRTCRFWRKQKRIDNTGMIPDHESFLKKETDITRHLTILKSVTYNLLNSGEVQEKWRPNERHFLVLNSMKSESDAHGHDDVAVTVGFVGKRAHLAGRLFVLQFDADRAFRCSAQKIEHIAGVETDRDCVALVFLVDVFFGFAIFRA